MAERSVVVASAISTDSHFTKALRRGLSQFCLDIRILLVPRSLATSRQDQGFPLNLDVHGRIDQGEKAMSWSYPGKTWLFSMLYPPEERRHRCFQAKVDFVEQLPIDLHKVRIVSLRGLQAFLGNAPAGPLLAVSQAHDPPIVQPSTFRLHKF